MKKLLVLLVTVLMLAACTNAAFEKVNTYNGNFSDVADSAWYAENVKTAYELGFMNGKSEGKFDPNGNVTVVEAITMASRLHAIYNGTEVKKKEFKVDEVRFDFDNGTQFVPYGKDGIYLHRAVSRIENDALVFQPDAPNSVGNYNPQVFLEGINLDARMYDKLTVRIKRDDLPNVDPDKPRVDNILVYFKTTTSPTITAEQHVKVTLSDIPEEWIEFDVELGSSDLWKDTIKGIRLDPSGNNGVYYIDSMVFSKSADTSNEKWYDMYIDYAVDNGIIEPTTFDVSEYNRNITRAEMCTLFASALPEEYYTPINNIKGIPDVMRDEKNADVYLMLYNAGILLGSDAEGTFNPKSDIKRSEVAAIINRAALPDKRVKGSISADWSTQGNKYDLEFDDETYLEKYEYVGETVEIKNGKVVIKSLDRESLTPRFATRVIAKNIDVDASQYSKLRVRMKPEFIGEPTKKNIYFYFHTDEDAGFSDLKAINQNIVEFSYVDPAGWYVLELDLSLHPEWKGNITSIRFDACSIEGIYSIDYIRLANADPLNGASHQVLINEGYTATKIVKDSEFERGFYVPHVEQKQVDLEQRKWQDYTSSTEKPLWQIGAWWSDYDLWENRAADDDKYTLSNTQGVDTITYNPEEKSLTMRLNGTKVYNGKPHVAEERHSWPHFLIDQNSSICAFDKTINSANADRMFLELDVRLVDYKPTTNPEGTLVCDFLAFFYLQTDKAPGQRIWFGFDIFKGATLEASKKATPMWAKDSAAKQYIYGIPSAVLYDGIENSLNPEPGVALDGGEWKHIRLDVTSHIARAVEWANRDNAFGVPVTVEDMFISGMNIGFEMRGNFDCTVEFKNFNMIAYNK